MAKTYKYKGSEASLMLESRADCQFVVEAEDSHVPSGALGRLFGVYAYMDQKNENGRTYDFENYFAQVQALQPAIKAKRLLGELEHVKRRTVRYGNVSHRLDSIEWNPEKRRFEGYITILDTPAGRIAWAIVTAGSPLFISSRALGVVNPTTGRVQLLKIVTFDLVAQPGFSNAEFNLVGSVNESKDTLICESADDEDSPNSLMLQLIELARTGMLQKLFPDALISSASLDALKQQLINESIEDFTTMTNQSRFVEAYNNADANEVGVENIQKVEALLDEVGCDYTDVGLATAFDALSEENKKQAMSLLALEFANEGAMFKYNLSNLSNEDIIKMAKDMGYVEQGIDIEREDPMTLLHYIAVDLSNDDIAKKHAKLLKKYNIKSLDESKYDISKLDDAALTELAKALELEVEDKSIDDIKAAIEAELDSNLDKHNDVAKQYGIVECDEALNFDYLDAAWGALTDEVKTEIVEAAKVDDKDAVIAIKSFKDIPAEAQQPVIDAMLDKNLIEKELVNIDESADNKWDALSDDERKVILDKLSLSEFYRPNVKWQLVDKDHKLKIEAEFAADEAKHATLGEAWDSFTDDQRQSILSKHIGLPYNAKTKWAGIDIAHHAMLEKDIDAIDEAVKAFAAVKIGDNIDTYEDGVGVVVAKIENVDDMRKFTQKFNITSGITNIKDELENYKDNPDAKYIISKLPNGKYCLDMYDAYGAQVNENNEGKSFVSIWDTMSMLNRATALKAVQPDKSDEDCFQQAHDNEDALGKELVDALKKHLNIDEASDPAADWWYNASVADRNQLIEQIGKDKIGVEDAANASWEMFDNESRNAIAAAIRAQSTDESSKAANAFLAWHDNGRPNGAKMEKLNKIYDIFMSAGCSSDMDVDKCFDLLSKADKQAVLSIAGLTDVNIDEGRLGVNEATRHANLIKEIAKKAKAKVEIHKSDTKPGKSYVLYKFPTFNADALKEWILLGPGYAISTEKQPNGEFHCKVDMELFNDAYVSVVNESIEAPYDMSNGITKGDKITIGDIKNVSGTTEIEVEVWPAGKPEQKFTLRFDDKKDPEYLALVDDCDESIEAWNAADVAARKAWLLSKNYLDADSEYYASQPYDSLPVDVQNFVKEFFEAPVDEAAVGDNIKIYDADGNEFEAVVNTIDNNEAGTRLTVTYGESTSGIVAEIDGKWTLVPASEPGKIVNESIVADKLYAAYSDTDKSIIDKFYQDDIVKTCIKNIDPDKSTMDDKVAAAYDELIKAQKSAEAVDELEANKSLLIAYIAAQLQDEMVNEGKLSYKPKSAKFINEAAEDSKPTPADVEQIIDGLVDASTITRAQADELIDAVSDAADLDKVENKAQLAEKIAETAEELGFDVDVEECMSMVNEGVDDNIREAVLKDKSYDDFDFRTVERDGSTISVVISKDGQLTGIEVAGDLTDANQKMLSDMLRTYLGAQATDECLTNIKHEIAALRRQTKQLATRYDAAGVAVLDENLQPIDHTPLYLKHMPTAYKYIYESLTPEQKSLIATQAAVRTFVNESDVAAFYRSRNWAAIKSYSTKQPVGFVNENIDGSGKSSLTPEQQRLVDLIRG